MDAIYSLLVTLFWLVYTPLLLVAAAMFGWALHRYLRSRRTPSEPKTQSLPLPRVVTSELIALQAQFIVAPKIARQEALSLLRQCTGEEADPQGARLSDDFESL